ncbi:MAG: amidohydrolase [Planctomycetaceae bacterium]|nr:amidohydrolase [Planctomycetaceae bacterium]MBT4725313.1 amidohydrolase [Planctomycetaceae bacterium]MBT5123268.1 amidohydrolase [Planctomycetaceae bacterium]MBT5600086.1 amidohydrolase [Planctomycetaceae bacterium]MBT5883413.1 amidohydrolase [Planctomycetaceae bacterium]
MLLRSELLAERQSADLILHSGKIVTVNPRFEIAEAMAVRGERIMAVGRDSKLLKLAGPDTKVIDLDGKMVIPGLIDSHVHSTGAAVYEYDHPVPVMNTIADVLEHVKQRADALQDGQWIRLSQVFITRLADQRFPTRQELDAVAPHNPVVFRTGPDQALNSLALKLSGIDRDTEFPAGRVGVIEKDPQTGELTGIIRNGGSLVKYQSAERSPEFSDRQLELKKLIANYNSVGITSISDRNASDSAVKQWRALMNEGGLNVRVFLYYSLNANVPLAEVDARIKKAINDPLHEYNNMLWLRGVKVFLDGGMLTGSAYMNEPWGVSKIYSITDPEYRGTRYIDPERLYQVSLRVLDAGLQMTAHSVGDGAVSALVQAYATIDADDFRVAAARPCITHCNFMSRESIKEMARLGIVADLQPAWLYMDGKTLLKQFGEIRTKYFQPYRSLFDRGVIVGGGSDHMQKIGSLRSVNPYNPFLGMWITLKRQPRNMDGLLHAEQCLKRHEALRLYTINNAYLTFEEKVKGSLEAGKLADFVIVDRDILKVKLDDIKDTRVLSTYIGGRLVYTTRD